MGEVTAMSTSPKFHSAASWAAITVLAGGAFDLYLVTVADRWMALSVGAIGSVASLSLLFLPKLLYGAFIGWVTSAVAKATGSNIYRWIVLLGFIAYFIWKFFVVEVWIAPELLAYILACGPYVGFFVGFGMTTLIIKSLRNKGDGGN